MCCGGWWVGLSYESLNTRRHTHTVEFKGYTRSNVWLFGHISVIFLIFDRTTAQFHDVKDIKGLPTLGLIWHVKTVGSRCVQHVWKKGRTTREGGWKGRRCQRQRGMQMTERGRRRKGETERENRTEPNQE